MFSFAIHIRELTVEFTCFLEIGLGKTTPLPFFQSGEYLGHLFSDYSCNDKKSWG